VAEKTSNRNDKVAAKPRLWVVSQVYFPDLTSTGYYLTAIAEGLADKYDVKVLCGQPNYSAREEKAPWHEKRSGTEVLRVAGTRLNKDVIVFRLINMLTLGISVFLTGIRRFGRGDRVLVVTTPPSMPFLVAGASLIRGASYTLLIHDSYPEILIAVGKLRKNSFATRVIDFFNRWLYKHAWRIIVVGRDMQALVGRKTDGLNVEVSVIPNWAELDDVYPTPREENTLIRELGISDKLIILHAGNIGHPTDVETIIECLKKLAKDDRFHFVFVGSGVKARLLEAAKKGHNLSNITMLGQLPRGDQIQFLNACDVGLVSLVANMKGAAMPSKTYNIMAAGKPVLALTDAGSELYTVIEEDQIGWQIPSGDAKAMLSLLNEIYRDRYKLPEIGRRARRAAEAKYSLARALEDYSRQLK
jgi:colanic acid biosynthesis glycosyl transferase WcaI